MKFGITDQWKIISDESQVEELLQESYSKPVVLFKTSTRCGVSNGALSRFKEEMSAANNDGVSFYLLDVASYKAIASVFSYKLNVKHESPQALVIEKGLCGYHKSHWSISFTDLMSYIANQRMN